MLERRIQDMSSRRLQGIYWGCIPHVLQTNIVFIWKKSVSVSKKYKLLYDKSLSEKPVSDKSMTNPRQIQDALIRTQ